MADNRNINSFFAENISIGNEATKVTRNHRLRSIQTTMESATISSNSRRMRRKRPISSAIALALPIAILSQIASRDFSSPSAAFVTGLSIPLSKTKRHGGLFEFTDYQHPRGYLKPQPCFLSDASFRIHKRQSLCLLDATSLSDDQKSSTAVSTKSERISETKISLSGDGGQKGLLMNPMEDFGTKVESETTGFDAEYKRGLLTIGFITFLFATNSPVLHWAFTSGANPPPVLLVNAAVSIVALVGLLLGGDTLEDTSSLPTDDSKETSTPGWVGGLELGIWKFLGTTSNLYGLALTTASHGALLIQLTTLIVPTTRALVYKESIPTKLKLSIGLALSGVLCFANDPTGTPSLLGDALCVVAAICYSAYDLRLYEYGKVVDAVKPLITTKIATQALFSLGLLYLAPATLLSEENTAISSLQESSDYLQALAVSQEWLPVVAAVVWSGVAVNAIAPFLQVGGQQIVGPTKCQTIYASQPLWAAGLSFIFLGERLGLSGMVGGSAFLIALALAATAETSTTTAETEDNEPILRSSIAIQDKVESKRTNATTVPIEFN